MLPKRITSASDLVTSRTATCKGFSEQANVKSQRAAPYVRDAIQFWEALKRVKNKQGLLDNETLREGLISTAGVSAKARHYLTEKDIKTILEGIIEGIQADREASFREEILCRYLLTRGASLDGEMRNYTGASAARQLVVTLLAVLSTAHNPLVFFAKRRQPLELPEATLLAHSEKVQAIRWADRVLLFDKKPKFIAKNIDAILLNTAGATQARDVSLLEQPGRYLACGELKGGIDPAGADEHWKTAKSALDRIRTAFGGKKIPALFFVGAAIESAMAQEIFADLQAKRLTHAANLTVAKQVQDLISWLVSL